MIKEKARKFLERLYKIGNRPDKKTVLFVCLNHTVSDIAVNAKRNNCNVLFLPYHGESKMDWKNNTLYDFTKPDFIDTYNNAKNFYFDFLRNNNVNYFVIDKIGRHEFSTHAAIGAAIQLPNVKLIYLEHGHTGTENNYFDYYLLRLFDIIYCASNETKASFERQKIDYKLSNREIRQWTIPRRKTKIRKKENMILFAPAFSSGDRFVNLYPDTVRLLHFIEYLRVFNEFTLQNPEFIVVWKGIKASDCVNMHVDEMIKKIDNKNIKYVDGAFNFDYYLSRSKALITDCLSTTFYDAIQSKVPVLFMRYKFSVDLIPEAKQLFDGFVDEFVLVDEFRSLLKTRLEKIKNNDYLELPELNYKQDKWPWE